MLSLALVLATIFGSPKAPAPSPLHVACPANPAAYTALPAARTRPAIELTGRIDASGVVLDPAFDVEVAPSELAHPGHGDAVIAGYAADGRALFAQSFSATGSFHLYVPLSSALAQSVQRLELVSGDVKTEVVASSHRDPEVESLSLDSGRYLLAWNAHEFPSVRIDPPQGAPILLTGGTSTYEERTVDDSSHTVVVEFSDGVQSITRPIRIFGR